jgi:hypothetical protein
VTFFNGTEEVVFISQFGTKSVLTIWLKRCSWQGKEKKIKKRQNPPTNSSRENAGAHITTNRKDHLFYTCVYTIIKWIKWEKSTTNLLQIHSNIQVQRWLVTKSYRNSTNIRTSSKWSSRTNIGETFKHEFITEVIREHMIEFANHRANLPHGTAIWRGTITCIKW